MHRHERRMALLHMLTAERTLAKNAAQKLNVSIRTIYRDVAWLRDRGYVVASVPGPRGGSWLSERSQPAPGALSVDRLRQIAVHLAATGADAELVGEVIANLPPKIRQRVSSMVDATQAAAAVPLLDAGVAASIELAMKQRWPLAIGWQRVQPGRSPRETVLPRSLRLRDGRWVLEGLEQRDGAEVECPIEEMRTVDRSYRRWIRDRSLSARYRYRRPDDPPPRPALAHRSDGFPPGAIALL